MRFHTAVCGDDRAGFYGGLGENRGYETDLSVRNRIRIIRRPHARHAGMCNRKSVLCKTLTGPVLRCNVYRNRKPANQCYRLGAVLILNTSAHLYPRLGEVEFESKRLPHEHIRVVTVLEGSLQLLQLPPAEIGARAPTFRSLRVAQVVGRVCAQLH